MPDLQELEMRERLTDLSRELNDAHERDDDAAEERIYRRIQAVSEFYL